MTSLIAWIAVDQRAPSAVYLASDSRISWQSKQQRWDAGRKLFHCRDWPDIFGYVGEVLFPSMVLGQIIDAADNHLLFEESDNAEKRHLKVLETFRHSFGRRSNSVNFDFSVLHFSRDHSGPRAKFHLWRIDFSSSTSAWTDHEIAVSHDRSSLLSILGSGTGSFRTQSRKWETSSQAGTSRAIFSALCNSIGSGTDPYSGGVPQLAGMYHTRLPRPFGVVLAGQRYFHGLPIVNVVEGKSIEWRDGLFQRIDGKTLHVVGGAQRHIRPS